MGVQQNYDDMMAKEAELRRRFTNIGGNGLIFAAIVNDPRTGRAVLVGGSRNTSGHLADGARRALTASYKAFERARKTFQESV